MVILGLVQDISWIIDLISSMFGWCCCDDGCFIWVLVSYVLLRLLVRIYVSCWIVFVVWMANSIAYSSTIRFFL